jgi:hypothetical protein
MPLKTFPSIGPKITNVTKTTRETKTRINAYSTRPCALSLAWFKGIHLLSLIVIEQATPFRDSSTSCLKNQLSLLSGKG